MVQHIILTHNYEEVIELKEHVGIKDARSQYENYYPYDKSIYNRMWVWQYGGRDSLSGSSEAGDNRVIDILRKLMIKYPDAIVCDIQRFKKLT